MFAVIDPKVSWWTAVALSKIGVSQLHGRVASPQRDIHLR